MPVPAWARGWIVTSVVATRFGVPVSWADTWYWPGEHLRPPTAALKLPSKSVVTVRGLPKPAPAAKNRSPPAHPPFRPGEAREMVSWAFQPVLWKTKPTLPLAVSVSEPIELRLGPEAGGGVVPPPVPPPPGWW